MKPQNQKLAIAAAIGDTVEVEKLIKAGVILTAEAHYIKEFHKFSYSSVYQSFIDDRDRELCRVFLDEEDIQDSEESPRLSSVDNTALHEAAFHGQLDVLKLFLGMEYELEWKDKRNVFGPSLMIAAILGGHPDIVEALIEAGVNVNYSADDDLLPLNVAVGIRHVKITEILLKNKADVNAVSDAHVFPPLLEAIYFPYFNHTIQNRLNVLPVVKLLLTYGADVNCQAKGNNSKTVYTPLALAVRKCMWEGMHLGFFSIVKTLLNNGADIHTLCTKDFWSYTPLSEHQNSLFLVNETPLLLDLVLTASERLKVGTSVLFDADCVHDLADCFREQIRKTSLYYLTKAEIGNNQQAPICTALFDSKMFHVKLLELAVDFVVEKSAQPAVEVARDELPVAKEDSSQEETSSMEMISEEDVSDLSDLEEAMHINNSLKRVNSGGIEGIRKKTKMRR